MTMQRILRTGLLSALLVLALLGRSQAYTLEEYTFDDPARSAQFRHLVERLRCLVCQNESLAASQAGVAEDLRQQIYEMLRAGASEQEVITYLVERYGDFVLYEPPLKPATYVLWFGPLLLAGAGGWFLIGILRRQRHLPESQLSSDEQERLRRLTGASSESADAHDPTRPAGHQSS